MQGLQAMQASRSQVVAARVAVLTFFNTMHGALLKEWEIFTF